MASAGPVVVIGRAGVRTGYAMLLGGIALIALAVTHGLSGTLLYYLVLLTGATAWQLFVRGGEQVLLEPDALVVVKAGRHRRYAWSDVLEMAWRKHGTLWVGPGPVVRVRGGPFDEPGPNLPAQIASLPVFGVERVQLPRRRSGPQGRLDSTAGPR